MKDIEIRLLRADEISCRIQQINQNGLSLLLYKDARTDIQILNETFGVLGWKKSYQSINGELFCTVEVYDDEKKEWISRQDVGSPSFTDPEKGRASDSFKRACTAFGGTELYSSPYIYIPPQKYTAEKTDKGYKLKDRFRVDSIAYNDNREITELTIVNQKDETVFEYKERKKREKQPDFQLSIQQINELHQELNRTGVSLDDVLQRYAITGVSEMTPEIYNKAMRSLKMTNRKVA